MRTVPAHTTVLPSFSTNVWNVPAQIGAVNGAVRGRAAADDSTQARVEKGGSRRRGAL